MTFRDLVLKLNDEIAKSNLEIGNFQQYRAYKRGTPPANKAFFNYKDFMFDEGYSYHIGGSNEFQFNIGYENTKEGGQLLRYGMAFSLQPSKSIPNPEEYRTSDIERFNLFFKNNKKYFNSYSMWIFTPNVRTKTFPIRKIRKADIKRGNFIFLGKYLSKSLQEISTSDFDEIISTFEYLFPLYKHVQLREPFSTDKRYARLTWNTKQWHSPIYHKWSEANYNNSSKKHEEKHGYGHEEWLFNPRFQTNGYQYGFVQGVNQLKKEQDFIKELTLFTINPVSGTRYLVAKINDVEIITNDTNIQEEVKPLFNKYKSTMINELKEIGADYKYLKREGFIPNIRFRSKNIFFYESGYEASFLNSQKFTRFNSYIVENHTELQKQLEEDKKEILTPGEGKTSGGHKRTTASKTTDVVQFHKNITDSLRDYLINQWDLSLEKTLSVEKTKVDGGLIDVIALIEDKHIIFEVKTRATAKGNIREALGQLLEYSFYKNNWNISKMIIVGPAEPNQKDLSYLKILNKLISHNIEYWQFVNDETNIKDKFIIYSKK